MGWEVGAGVDLKVSYIYHTLKVKNSHCMLAHYSIETTTVFLSGQDGFSCQAKTVG